MTKIIFVILFSFTFSGTLFAQTAELTFFSGQRPAQTNLRDGVNVNYELGLSFRSDKAGTIKAIRFWKASKESRSHTGKIYSADGTLLASVTFQNESASGWQTQNLKTPLAIAANTEYTVAVNTALGYYVATTSGLATPVSNGALRTVRGVYGPVGQRPIKSWNNSNYFRDVVFSAEVAPPPQPAPVAGWINQGFPAQSGAFTAIFDVVPSSNQLDTVIGLSRGAASAYSDVAAAVRFATDGTLDARNASAFARVNTIPYSANVRYRIRMEVDVLSRNYSVYVTPAGQGEVALASDYSFRSEQAAVESLANLASYSPTGSVAIANFSVVPAVVTAPPPPPPPPPQPQPSGVKPSAANTGWQHTGVTLTPASSMTITTAGTVIDAKDISGSITIRASNVTIRRSRIRTSNYFPIRVMSGTGIVIEDVEIDGMGGSSKGILVDNGQVTIRRVNIHDSEDGLSLNGSGPIVLRDSYIHSPRHSSEGHSDGAELYSGGPMTIENNNFDYRGANTSAFNFSNWGGPIRDVLFNGNWLAGGAFILYVDGNFDGGPISNVRITNNRFVRGSSAYGTHVVRGNLINLMWSGNVFDDNGQLIGR